MCMKGEIFTFHRSHCPFIIFFSTLFAPVGFDIQISGFGLSKTYHADNEYALLSDMIDAMQILLIIISINDEKK